MGIEVQSVRLLAMAAELGVDFSETLTIGRQRVMASEKQVAAALGDFKISVSAQESALIAGRDDPFSSRLFQILGARSIDALDYSDYEGATVIHDLNSPLPSRMESRYSAVFDGGTLEHVFNLPTALGNLMRLPRVGGHLIVAAPANNEMGHGFYQFSPELFFRALSAQNGYQIVAVFIAPFFCRAPWLMVRDPGVSGIRAGYSGWAMPTYVMVIARRIAATTPFERSPQQTDYVEDWTAANTERPPGRGAGRPAGWREDVHRIFPPFLLDRARQLRARWSRPDHRSMVAFDPARGGPSSVRSFYE